MSNLPFEKTTGFLALKFSFKPLYGQKKLDLFCVFKFNHASRQFDRLYFVIFL